MQGFSGLNLTGSTESTSWDGLQKEAGGKSRGVTVSRAVVHVFVSSGRAVKLLLGGWDVFEGRRAHAPFTLSLGIILFTLYLFTLYHLPSSLEWHLCQQNTPVSLWKGTKASKAPGGSLQATEGDEGTAEFAIWRDCGLLASCWRVCSCQCSLNYTFCFQ